jgi:hypothetical protein
MKNSGYPPPPPPHNERTAVCEHGVVRSKPAKVVFLIKTGKKIPVSIPLQAFEKGLADPDGVVQGNVCRATGRGIESSRGVTR